ncbi:hypothetical protein K458DRAFT_408577 [Lentithecium fluviatile CBS 122367]|uniref:Uncharacterized protein n=1 Tax=Lentithecium fluviatile CBS 122367 TaxID=1168545 RepID=A0A6G1IKY5_9PLEO|nr:hypothetical protein K458DRAFT_408577 [Lentithecium fluviatile CBS 122367]
MVDTRRSARTRRTMPAAMDASREINQQPTAASRGLGVLIAGESARIGSLPMQEDPASSTSKEPPRTEPSNPLMFPAPSLLHIHRDDPSIEPPPPANLSIPTAGTSEFALDPRLNEAMLAAGMGEFMLDPRLNEPTPSMEQDQSQLEGQSINLQGRGEEQQPLPAEQNIPVEAYHPSNEGLPDQTPRWPRGPFGGGEDRPPLPVDPNQFRPAGYNQAGVEELHNHAPGFLPVPFEGCEERGEDRSPLPAGQQYHDHHDVDGPRPARSHRSRSSHAYSGYHPYRSNVSSITRRYLRDQESSHHRGGMQTSSMIVTELYQPTFNYTVYGVQANGQGSVNFTRDDLPVPVNRVRGRDRSEEVVGQNEEERHDEEGRQSLLRD